MQTEQSLKYTFLLPAFKCKYLAEMLTSIQNQTYTNFKVIISDDCSPQDLITICNPYMSDNRFHYRRNDVNIGSRSLVEHWNLLVDMCESEYLIVASDDDVYSPFFLECMDGLVKKYPDVDLLRARVQKIDNGGEVLVKDFIFEELESFPSFVYSLFSGVNHIHCLANYVFKTKRLKEIGGFIDFPSAWYSDDATALTLSAKGVANSSDVLFSFRASGDNISSALNDTPLSRYKKVEASMLFIKWLDSFSTSFIPIVGKFEKSQIASGLKKANSHAASLARIYAKGMGICQSCHVYEFLNNRGLFNGTLDKIRFFVDMLKAKLKICK